MANFLIYNFITIILISALVSFVYLKIYKVKINERLITNEGGRLLSPLAVTILTTITTIVISFILFFILSLVDAFSTPKPLPNPLAGYDYYSYDDIKPNMQVSIYKPYLDNEETIPGYELQESNEIDNFKYYLYINKETKNQVNFILFIKYQGEEIPNLDTMFGIYTRSENSSKYNGQSFAGKYHNAYLIKGYVKENIYLKINFEHRIIKIVENQKDIENYETYAKFEKEFLLTP